jgi:hypothetical protein
MKLPLTGPTYTLDSRSFAAERCVNLIPIVSESGKSKEPDGLQGSPGLDLFSTAGGGPIRNGFVTADRAFVVSGNTLYELSDTGTATSRGTLNSSTNRVSMAANATQLMIVDGADGYILTLATNNFAEIADADFPGGDVVAFIDQYFVVNRPGTAQFFISAIGDGTSWDALDFTTVESNPDDLVSLLANQGELILGGKDTTEVYYNSGNASFPFERIRGAVMPVGIAAAHTLQRFDNSAVWLGRDENGRGVVWRANGYQPVRISTKAIERLIATTDEDISESYAWVYHQQGHIYYCLQVKGLDTTLVYDGSTGLWHERTYYDPNLSQERQHRASCHFFFAENNMVGDRESGKIYKLRLDVYDDEGDEIRRIRRFPAPHNEGKRIFWDALHIDCEPGVGLSSGQGSDPQMVLRYSNDGAHTWSEELTAPMGALGNYKGRSRFTRLGSSRDRVYEVVITDPVQVMLIGAYAQVRTAIH